VRLLLTQLLFALLALIFTFEFGVSSGVVLYVVLTIAIIGLLLNYYQSTLSYMYLGICICLVPIFGHASLGIVVSMWLLGRSFKKQALIAKNSNLLEVVSFSLIVFLLSLSISAVRTIILELDINILIATIQNSGLTGLFLLRPVWLEPLFVISQYLVSGFLILAFARRDGSQLGSSERTLSAFFAGLGIGAILSFIFTVLQINRVNPLFFYNMNPFWDSVGRFSGSFSDPNSFGVMAAILVPLLFFVDSGRGKIFFRLAAISLFLIVPWSGSRTFWLCMFIWFLILSSRAFKRAVLKEEHSKRSQATVVSVVTIVLAIIIVLGHPIVNSNVKGFVSSPGAHRVLQTMNWNTMYEMFSSRKLFAELAIEQWRANKLVGVGLTRFNEELPQAKKSLGFVQDKWEDNANNYYLHVLAEQGLLGLFFTLISFTLFSLSLRHRISTDIRSTQYEVLRYTLIVMLILLFTGPHIHFQEVQFLLAILLGFGIHLAKNETLSLRSFTLGIAAVEVLLLIALLINIVTTESPMHKGFYKLEREDNTTFAWSVDRATLALCGEIGRNLVLEIRSNEPGISKNPVQVNVDLHSQNDPSSKEIRALLVLKNNKWNQIRLRDLAKNETETVRLEISVNRLWSPMDAGLNNDARWLGVMIKWPKEAC
jgi:hypothetical protein